MLQWWLQKWSSSRCATPVSLTVCWYLAGRHHYYTGEQVQARVLGVVCGVCAMAPCISPPGVGACRFGVGALQRFWARSPMSRPAREAPGARPSHNPKHAAHSGGWGAQGHKGPHIGPSLPHRDPGPFQRHVRPTPQPAYRRVATGPQPPASSERETGLRGGGGAQQCREMAGLWRSLQLGRRCSNAGLRNTRFRNVTVHLSEMG